MANQLEPPYGGTQYRNAFVDKQDSPTSSGTKEEKTFKNMMCTVFENTTAHGIPNILRSETTIGKIIWSLLFSIAVGFLIYQSKELVEKFLTYPVDVQLDIEYNSELEFPAVTICNINPIRVSKLENVSDPELQDSNKKKESDQCDGLPPEEENGPNDVGPVEEVEYQGWDYFISKPDAYETETMAREEMETLATLLSDQNLEERKKLGHQIKDLLVSCSWAGFACSHENFTFEYFNSFHGNCYTFNRKKDKISDFTTKRTKSSGPSSGLRLVLFIEQDEYLYDVSSSAGVRVVVHDQNRMPFPEDEGYFVPPGYHTSIALRKVKIDRISRSLRPCMSLEDTEDYVDHYSMYGVRYSQQTCTKTCYQQKLIETCKCYDVYYPNNETHLSIEEKTVRACDLSNHTEDECVEDFAKNFTYLSDGCPCEQPCRTISYNSDISMSYWPSKNYKENLKQSLFNFSKPLRRVLEDDCKDSESIRQNLLALDIYYQDLNFEIIKQSYTYTSIDLVGAVGGLVGLWLGLSILTVFEAVELCLNLSRFFFYKTILKSKSNLAKTPVGPTRKVNGNVFTMN
ncbi:acid-sensing ion channel 2-like [Antedon mediterranea]|uniref:acid-sensing ion channel 2-like n=1 Tax=Antedon mediterranea TaxID=105859 RepID=UPI003AF6B4E9